MDNDGIACLQHEATKTKWLNHMASIGADIVKLASKHCNGQPCYPAGIAGGAFNYCITVEFDKHEGIEAKWMMRFPIPGAVMHPEAKVRHEVAIMKYLDEKTSIPVPKIVASGTAEENIFDGVGPFIIMEFVEGKPLYEVLRGVPIDEVFREKSVDEFFQGLAQKAANGEGDDEALSPSITDDTLAIVYRQLANVYLELAEHDFDNIGSLAPDEGAASWVASAAPYTNYENEMERCCGVPKEDRSKPYPSAADYYLRIAQRKIEAARLQRNIAEDTELARQTYVARHLFRALVPSFIDYKHNEGPYKLVCDDLRPGNILVDRNLKITAICDWEWSYAAPYQQFYTAPRWLMLKAPEYWRITEPYDDGSGDGHSGAGLDDMLRAYTKKLDLFLKIMQEEEAKRAAVTKPSARPHVQTHDPVQEKEPLSALMRKSFTNGQFWFNECLRAYNFDLVYWIRLDDVGYGSGSTVEDRVKAWASIPANSHIEAFMEQKLSDLEAYKVAYKALQG